MLNLNNLFLHFCPKCQKLCWCSHFSNVLTVSVLSDFNLVWSITIHILTCYFGSKLARTVHKCLPVQVFPLSEFFGERHQKIVLSPANVCISIIDANCTLPPITIQHLVLSSPLSVLIGCQYCLTSWQGEDFDPKKDKKYEHTEMYNIHPMLPMRTSFVWAFSCGFGDFLNILSNKPTFSWKKHKQSVSFRSYFL